MAEGTTPERKWAGKYNSAEEMEKGLFNLVSELEKLKTEKQVIQTKAQADERLMAELKQMYQAKAAEKQAPIVHDGELDEQALMGLINNQMRKVEEKLAQVPNTIQQTLAQLLGPVQAVNEASNEFFARDDLDEGFSRETMEKYLARNPGIRKTYETLVGNPQTAAEAYNYAYGQWRTTRPTSGTAVNSNAKRDAGSTPRAQGTPVDIPQEGAPDAKALAELAQRARWSGDDMTRVAYLKARLEGSPALEALKEVARERGWRE